MAETTGPVVPADGAPPQAATPGAPEPTPVPWSPRERMLLLTVVALTVVAFIVATGGLQFVLSLEKASIKVDPEQPAIFLSLFVLMAALAFSFARDVLYTLRGKETPESTTSRVTAKAIQDPPAFLAALVTFTIAVLAITKIPVPDPLSQAFFVIVGFYFGRTTRGVKNGSVTGAGPKGRRAA